MIIFAPSTSHDQMSKLDAPLETQKALSFQNALRPFSGQQLRTLSRSE